MSPATSPTLPAMLAANPRLDRWVGFPAPGRVAVSTGRVEIGQGVLTAMRPVRTSMPACAPSMSVIRTTRKMSHSSSPL
jgi:hypothetical protein